MFDDLIELYQEVILDHGKSPRNFRTIDNTTYFAHGNNPMCGDALAVFLLLNDEGLITDISFKGAGCAISVASASIMTQVLKGKTKDEAEALFDKFRKMCTEDDFVVEEDNDDMDRLQALSGVKVFPARVKCATLAWHTMDAAMNNENEATTE